MMKRLFIIITIFVACILCACNDDESFSSHQSDRLIFSSDTIHLDTLFTTIPSSTYTFWVYNKTGHGVRLRQVRLERGNQSGYRVNVDGVFLSQTLGYQSSDIEIRKGDSIRVFVQLTPSENHIADAQLVEDNLLFVHENGIEQKVNLRAFAFDALKLTDLIIANDTIIESTTPIIIYGDGIRVEENATLTIKNTTLYFHNDAGIDVNGNLEAYNSTFRGDRLDHMFDYLPYDRVSGQWKGINIHSQSTKAVLEDCIIKNAVDGIVCDTIENSANPQQVVLNRCVIHNCKGVGFKSVNSTVNLTQCQITNTLGDCVDIAGGEVSINQCTFAQFYPFSANRGAALRFQNGENINLNLHCSNTLITGYEEDVVMGTPTDTITATFNYAFSHCLLRTPAVDDAEHFTENVWETPKDSIQGKQHFVKIDEDNLDYDFHLDSLSTVYQSGIGCY